MKTSEVRSETTAHYPYSGTIYECETFDDLLEACQALKERGLSSAKLSFALEGKSFDGIKIFVANQLHYNESGECLESYDFLKLTMEPDDFSELVSDESSIVMYTNSIVIWEKDPNDLR